MALFTDDPVSDFEDLTAQDAQLLGTASVEGIDVTQKLRLAHEELALELDGLLDDGGSTGPAIWQTARASLRSVVVTPALKLWHTYRTLELVYRDAYSNQLNDRYAAKRDQFAKRGSWAYERLRQSGIGMCRNPIRQAHVPVVSRAPGNLADGTYYVSMAWLNGEGEEGAAATMTDFASAHGSFQVQPGATPTNARGWNVYVGTSPDTMSRQNDSPIGVGGTWLQQDSLVTGVQTPGRGQHPNYTKPVPRRIQRG